MKIKNIQKKYGDIQILKNINFDIQQCGLYFIVGHSGSGKTTLLNILSGLDQNYSGVILFQNKEVDLKTHFNLDYITQTNNLINELTLKENLFFAIKSKGKQVKELKINQMLKSMNLLKNSNTKAKFLSMGEQQRTAFARSVLIESDILLLDEPTRSLDIKNSKRIMQLINKLAKNKIIIMVTHNIDLIQKDNIVYRLCNGELFLENKKLLTGKRAIKKEISNNKIKIKEKLSLVYLFFKVAFKQLISFSVIFSSIIATFVLSDKLLGGIENKVTSDFINEFPYEYIQKKENTGNLTNKEFLKFINKNFNNIQSYNTFVIAEDMYKTTIQIDGKEIGDGFLLTKIYKSPVPLEADELILGGNINLICNQFSLISCEPTTINNYFNNQKFIINKGGSVYEYTIKGFIETDQYLVFSQDIFLNEIIFPDFDVKKYLLQIKENNLVNFFESLKQYNHLDVLSYENNLFEILIAKNSYFSKEELKRMDFNFIPLVSEGYIFEQFTGKGYFEKLEKVVNLENNIKGKQISFQVSDRLLLQNEIIVSSHIKEKLKLDIGDYCLFKFNNKDIFLKIVDVIEEKDYVIYQNSLWAIEFLTNIGVLNDRTNKLLIQEIPNELPNQYVIINPYLDVLESLNSSISSVEKLLFFLILFIGVSSFMVVIVQIYLLFEKFQKSISKFIFYNNNKKELFKILTMLFATLIFLNSFLISGYFIISKIIFHKLGIMLTISILDWVLIFSLNFGSVILLLAIFKILLIKPNILKWIKKK